MSIRTDLALEQREGITAGSPGVREEISENDYVSTTVITVENEEGAKAIGKPQGKYITLSFPSVEKINDTAALKKAIIEAVSELMPKERDRILLAGLGNTEITPDALGPLTVNRILATRHIAGDFAGRLGLKGLRSVAVMAPGVLGKTGIEVIELLAGAVERIKPGAVIVIDALAARGVSRLFTTIQLTDTGISPGSGVKNRRKEISTDTLHVPVIAIGIPTVVDAAALASDLTGAPVTEETDLIVTPKEVDLMCERAGGILAEALNCFLQPEIDEDILLHLV